MVNTSVQTNTDKAKPGSPKRTAVQKRKSAARKNGKSAKSRSRTQMGVTESVYRHGRNAVTGAYKSASEMGGSLPKMARNMHLRERGQSMYDMVEKKPLVFGAVGLGVGMVIAALLPSMGNRNSHR
jgi:hypothetical protein